MPDWKKEIRISDLFQRDKAEKRAAKASTPPAQRTPSAERPTWSRAAVPSADVEPPGGGAAAPSAPPPTAPTPSSAPHPPAAAPTGGGATPEAPAPAHTESATGEETGASQREVRASDLLTKMGWAGGGPTAPAAQASHQRTPRPDGPREADSPATDVGERSVWKRELKAGDLFRRREKAPPVPGDAFSEAEAEPVSFWKKEISLTDLLRKPGTQAESGSGAATGGPSDQPRAAGRRPHSAASLSTQLRSVFSRSRGPRRSPSHVPVAVPLTRAVNLIPPDLALQKKQAVGPAEIGVGVAALAVVVGLFLLFTSASSKLDTAQQRLAAIEAEQASLAEAAAFQAASGTGPSASPLLGEEAARATALSSALDSRTSWDRVLRRITVVMPADTWLRGLGGTSTTADLALNAGPGAELASTLTLTGYALNRDGVAKLLSRMEAIPELAAVQLLAATQTQLAGSTVVEYSITATLKDDSNAPVVASPIAVTP